MNKNEFREALEKGMLKQVKKGVREFGIDADLTYYIPFTNTPSSINEAYRWEYRPLHWAVLGNQLRVACYLIEQGANIDAQNKVGNTPLHLAIYLGHTDLALLFLEHGASLNIRNKEETHLTKLLSPEKNCTPLHYAVQWGDIRVVEKVLSQIINFRILNEAAFIDKYGRYEPIFHAKTPLQLALKRRLESNVDKNGKEIGVQISEENKTRLINLLSVAQPENGDNNLHRVIRQAYIRYSTAPNSKQKIFKLVGSQLSKLDNMQRIQLFQKKNEKGLTPLDLTRNLPFFEEKTQLVQLLSFAQPEIDDNELHQAIRQTYLDHLMLNTEQDGLSRVETIFSTLDDVQRMALYRKKNRQNLTPLDLAKNLPSFEEKAQLVQLLSFVQPEIDDDELHQTIRQTYLDYLASNTEQDVLARVETIFSTLNEAQRAELCRQKNKKHLTPLSLIMSFPLSTNKHSSRLAYFDKQSLILKLLRYGADPHTQNPETGDTILHLVIKELQHYSVYFKSDEEISEPENIISPTQHLSGSPFEPFLDIFEYCHHQGIVAELLSIRNQAGLTPLGLCALPRGARLLNNAMLLMLAPFTEHTLEKETPVFKRELGSLVESARCYVSFSSQNSTGSLTLTQTSNNIHNIPLDNGQEFNSTNHFSNEATTPETLYPPGSQSSPLLFQPAPRHNLPNPTELLGKNVILDIKDKMLLFLARKYDRSSYKQKADEAVELLNKRLAKLLDPSLSREAINKCLQKIYQMMGPEDAREIQKILDHKMLELRKSNHISMGNGL
ncbi:MAG: ankyrin repeat domain-containing protein [Gammaproteobacteria bacterium]|nr:ankyrin repeat domain-containing protein [Gammaproteobacteria bacterium]